MIHGEFEPVVPAAQYTADRYTQLQHEGITVEDNGNGTNTLIIPLSVAFGNPDLLEQVGEKTVLSSLTDRQYKNDEQIDNSLRSVLFQVPKPGIPDPTVCGSPVINPDCFVGVQDLGAIDVQRGRDHGMPSYNNLRKAYSLQPKRSFTDITGESTDSFPNDPLIDPAHAIDDPNILDFTELRDGSGNVIPLGSDEAEDDAVTGTRRSTLAARLKAIYGSVDNVDAFVGMIAEKHVRGSEFGELQQAIWKKQFENLRDGDRFFYANDPQLAQIKNQYGLTYQHTLAELIALDTGASVPTDVFHAS
jgi:hypothetical protein